MKKGVHTSPVCVYSDLHTRESVVTMTNWVPYNEHDELVRAMQQIKQLEDAKMNELDRNQLLFLKSTCTERKDGSTNPKIKQRMTEIQTVLNAQLDALALEEKKQRHA